MAKYTNIDLSKYSGGYKPSNRVTEAEKKKKQAEDNVANYGPFTYTYQGQYDSAMDAILNREKFSYDMNSDALYQQYKNQYTALGKLAMQDTMGQAAAMTGGYGNSYATSAGSQAYQSYLNQLNDRIPELMQLALSTYNAESDRLNNNFAILAEDRNTAYGEYTDEYNRRVNDRGYYTDNYNTAYSQDYAEWADNRSYDQTQYWNEYDAGYRAERDAVEDSHWQQQFDFEKEQASKSGGGAGGAGGADSSAPMTVENVRNAENFIKTLPTRTGWGQKNKANASSPEEVAANDKKYAKYIDGEIQKAYDAGTIGDNELAYILDYFRSIGVIFE